MASNPIRIIANRLGLDLHRYRPEADRLAWLRGSGIRTVFDIGANIGQFAKEIRAALPEAQIYSFEPLKECHEKLQAAFKGDTKFRSFNFALGEKEETVTMNKSVYTPSSSLLPMASSHKELFPHTKDGSPEQIKVKRLDDVWSEIDPEKEVLIKVDTQGYEDKVIAGGMSSFPKAKAVLIETSFVELYVGQPLFDDIYQKMRSFGFAYKGALHQKIQKETGEVIFEDAIFLKR